MNFFGAPNGEQNPPRYKAEVLQAVMSRRDWLTRGAFPTVREPALLAGFDIDSPPAIKQPDNSPPPLTETHAPEVAVLADRRDKNSERDQMDDFARQQRAYIEGIYKDAA